MECHGLRFDSPEMLKNIPPTPLELQVSSEVTLKLNYHVAELKDVRIDPFPLDSIFQEPNDHVLGSVLIQIIVADCCFA